MNKKRLTGVLAGMMLLSTAALAHFQMIYTPSSDVSNKKDVDFKLIFTHPAEGKEAHDMHTGLQKDGKKLGIEKFLVVHKGKTKDYVKKLKKIEFGSNKVLAYDFKLDKNSSFRGGGDWGLVAVPHPYYEASEDIYIQQITKVFVNKNEIMTDWNNRIAPGYPEILPSNDPMNVWVGGLFRGQVVDSNGKPVANAEIEVEYLNANVDTKNNRFTGKSKTDKNATLIYADENGYFSFIPQEKGYWGFAALGAGGEKTYKGKELSEDAVLWIEAK